MSKTPNTTDATSTNKPEKNGGGNRINLGITLTQGDRGMFIDPFVVRTIDSPLHTMHSKYEPERYASTNPVFMSIVDQIFKDGSLDSVPLLRPIPGQFLQEGDPVLDYIKKNYAEKIVKLYGSVDALPPQPVVETVFGNTRTLATREASTKRGLGKLIKLMVTARKMDQAEAERLFSRENNNRQANSPFQNFLIARDAIKKDGNDWSDLVKEFGMPAEMIRATYGHLLDVLSMPLVRAALAGRVGKAEVKRICKAHDTAEAQTAAMNAPKPEREQKAPPRTLGAVEKRSLHAIVSMILANPKQYADLLDLADVNVLEASMPKLADAPVAPKEDEMEDVSDCEKIGCAPSVEAEKTAKATKRVRKAKE